MRGRKYSVGSEYRYGFNGNELDKEVAGTTTYDYGFRIYSPAVGKFLSVAPLTNSYPWYTPYQFAGNMPIVAIDLDGLEEYVVTNYYDQKGKISETRITVLTKKQNGQRVNMQLQKEDGSYVATQNVLLRNVSYDGATSYTHQSSLNKQQQNIVEKATKELTQPKLKDEWAAGFGGGDEGGGDEGENLESEKKNYNNKNYNLTDYTSKNIVKPVPVKPKVKPPKTDTKPLPITKTFTNSYASTIEFKNLSNKVNGDPTSEINSIFSRVKASGVTNYSITIFGNIYSGGSFDEGGGTTALNLFTKYSNYGELALARANKIKELLVGKGLDPSKINTQLGNPNKGMTADYKITTSTTQ